MDQLIKGISALLNGDGGRRTQWGWAGRQSRAWDVLWTAAALVGLSWLIRRPVPVPVRGRRRELR